MVRFGYESHRQWLRADNGLEVDDEKNGQRTVWKKSDQNLERAVNH